MRRSTQPGVPETAGGPDRNVHDTKASHDLRRVQARSTSVGTRPCRRVSSCTGSPDAMCLCICEILPDGAKRL